jgi:hypothetical protein
MRSVLRFIEDPPRVRTPRLTVAQDLVNRSPPAADSARIIAAMTDHHASRSRRSRSDRKGSRRINYGNFILATKDRATGESRGVAVDLVHELVAGSAFRRDRGVRERRA